MLGIEHRGTDATGAAWRFANGGVMVQKRDVAASKFVDQLSVPKRAQTVIGHTRYATQGKPQVAGNNHPIQTDGIVGVHNGMVYNDDSLFMLIGTNKRKATVDSEAIFALLDYGTTATGRDDVTGLLSKVGGSAAVAWMDLRQDPAILNLARTQSSPMVIAHTDNGSLLFASTQDAIVNAAAVEGLNLTWVYNLDEGEYLQVKHGIITEDHKFKVAPTYVRKSNPTWANGVTSNPKWYKDEGEVECLYCHGWKNYTGRWGCVCPDNAGTAVQGTRISDSGSQNTIGNGVQVVDESDPLAEVVTMQQPRYDEVRGFWANTLIAANVLFCGHNISTPDETEWYLTRYRHRQDNIDTWAERVIRHLDGSELDATAKKCHAFLRPGDWVKTPIMGVEKWGQVVDVPDTFPHGEYLIRVVIPKVVDSVNAATDVEMVLVRRKSTEFVSYPKKKDSLWGPIEEESSPDLPDLDAIDSNVEPVESHDARYCSDNDCTVDECAEWTAHCEQVRQRVIAEITSGSATYTQEEFVTELEEAGASYIEVEGEDADGNKTPVLVRTSGMFAEGVASEKPSLVRV